MTKEELDAAKSNWWSRLQDFGEEVLRPQRSEKLGLTQQQMAKRIGREALNLTHVYGYERYGEDITQLFNDNL